MAEELLKSFEELDRIEEQYLSQIFSSDEEINRVEAEAVEKSIEAVNKCRTKEEFEALVGREA